MSTDSLKVLHVDDDPTQLQMMKLFFDQLDKSIHVVTCDSPLEAVKLVAEDGFDCVVSDYVMPEMNGIELAERIISIKNIPFILYTGQGSEEVAQRAFQTGIHDYIRKEIEPSHYEVLLNSIRHSVTKHRAEQIYRVVFDSNPDGIVVVHDNLIRYSNKASARVFGVRNESSLHGKCLMDYVINGDLDDMTWMSLQRIVSENSVVPFEFDIKGADDVIRRVSGSLQNMLFMGNPSQVYFLRDVTTIRRIEVSLLHATHRFEKLFELSPIGAAFCSLSGKLVKSNRAFREIFGLDDSSDDFNLLQEPEFYRRITSRLMADDSLNFDHELDLNSLTDNGYINSHRDDVIKLQIIISPILDPETSEIFLVQTWML